MRFKQTDQEKRARDNMYLSIDKVERHFCPRSCELLSKNKKFKGFLSFMGKNTPETMDEILKNILKEMPLYVFLGTWLLASLVLFLAAGRRGM